MVKPRQANSTLKLIDEYCSYYRNLFPEVRSFEAFTHLHADIISGSKPSLHLVTNTPKQRNSKA
jgi:SRSO17 transposase